MVQLSLHGVRLGIVGIVIIVALTMVITTGISALGQTDQNDVVLLSNRFNQDTFSNEVVGEVLNNGTRPLDKYDINIIAYFYDPAGVLVGSEQGFVDAQTLGEGDRSAFSVLLMDDTIMNEAATYDISINDERVLEGAPIDGGDSESEDSSSSNSDESSEENSDEDTSEEN